MYKRQALNRVPQEIPPIWFMRQAGRYHDHYQNLKKSHSFVELCKNPALSAQTALGPIEEFDFDVAILFSDILFPLESLGMDLIYDPGPIFKEHLTEKNASRIFINRNPISSLEFQGEAIEKTMELLPDDKSMIGFIGGPWTLLSFASAKNKSDKIGKIESYQWEILEEYIYPLLHQNISLQLQAGAELVMIFDSCAHQLVKDDLSVYLNKILSKLVKSFPNQVGYYAKDGISYDDIFAASDSFEVPFADDTSQKEPSPLLKIMLLELKKKGASPKVNEEVKRVERKVAVVVTFLDGGTQDTEKKDRTIQKVLVGTILVLVLAGSCC